MLEYKVINVHGGNLTDRFVDQSKINKLAAEGWKLVNIQQPPNVQNLQWVSGTFVRTVGEKNA